MTRLGAPLDPGILRHGLEGFLPSMLDELYGWQVTCMLLFATVATWLANKRKGAGERLDFHFVARNTAAGLTFPISLILIFYPVLPQVQRLFTEASVSIYLSLAGALGAMLTFYSLVR